MTHGMRQSSKGFSLIEAVVAMLVMGIGAAMLIQLFTVVERGQSWNQGTITARTMADHRLDFLTIQGFGSLPACVGALGCRASYTSYAVALGAAGGYQCTQYSADGNVPDPTAVTAEAKYRIDTIVQNHPDGARFPDTRLITVSVCWTDASRAVQQTQAQRAVVDQM